MRSASAAIALLLLLGAAGCKSPQEECRDLGGYCLEWVRDGGCELSTPACCESGTPACIGEYVTEKKADCTVLDRATRVGCL